ncbi:MAG: hypothetical protein IPK92_01080 [Nitrospira sp.]|jgi:hypothetical protein|nr:hypothetical protein [Nitrospira sp.]MBL8054330.1 hypothetical protein [Nitrospira sp.]
MPKAHTDVLLIYASLIAATVLTLNGCSSVTNTIAGLTTPQSTITGSNYVFFIDPSTASKQLSATRPAANLAHDIRPNDTFKVSLDFGFLRYLQAVDPFVIVYSEAWMGDSPRPTDPALTHRQIGLIKDGLTQNAKLPITNQAILGPVTLDEGGQDVHVTLKVVVLSKHDNEESIQLLNGIAGAVATAAPTYAPVAGAAAQLGAAIVAQNKDKIEFEHTFTFSPRKEQLYINGEKETTLSLREGQIAVFKGESEFRVVPYQHWAYYVWPFNWFGHNVDRVSKGFETKPFELESNYFNIIWGAVRLPVWIVKSFFIPAQWFPDRTLGTYPTDLAVEGYSIFCKDKDNWKSTDQSYAGLFFTRSYECPYKSPYSEKTHMVFSVEKTANTFGNFKELVTKFSEHGKTINDLSTSSSESRKFSTEQITKTFDLVKSAVIFQRAKRDAIDRARKEDYDASENYCNLKELGDSERRALIQMTVNRRVDSTTERFVDFLKLKLSPLARKTSLLEERSHLLEERSHLPNEKSNPSEEDIAGVSKRLNIINGRLELIESHLRLIPNEPEHILTKAFQETIEYIQSTAWTIPSASTGNEWVTAIWTTGWNKTLDATKESALTSRTIGVSSYFPKDEFAKLYRKIPTTHELDEVGTCPQAKGIKLSPKNKATNN